MILDRIKKLCSERGVTIKDLESEIHFSNGVIGKWDKVSPKVENVQKVADYFGVSVDYLLGRDPVPTSQEELELLAKVYDDEIHVLPHEEYQKAIELAKQIKSLPPDVRDNIEQQIKLWASQDKK